MCVSVIAPVLAWRYLFEFEFEFEFLEGRKKFKKMKEKRGTTTDDRTTDHTKKTKNNTNEKQLKKQKEHQEPVPSADFTHSISPRVLLILAFAHYCIQV